MTADYNLFLQNLEEYIFNEDKIVTYKWICNEFKIHVNTAKQLLYTFASKEDMKGKLLVTYFVSGINEDGISHTVSLVTEKNLSKVKSSLKTVTSEHVYSVQKATLSASLSDFYNVESETSAKLDRKLGTIHIDTDILRKEVKQLTIHTPEAKKAAVEQQKQQDKNNVFNKQKIMSPVKKNEPCINKKSEAEKPTTDTHNGTNIISPSKNKSKTSPKKLDKKGLKKSVSVKNGGIGAFFSKQATLAAQKQASKKDEVNTQKGEQGEEIENIPCNTLDIDSQKKSSVETSSTKESNSSQTKSSKKKEESEKRKKRKKRKNSSESTGANKKKMKRIMIASDSESSGDEAEMEVEEPPPPMSPEPVAKAESDDEIIPPTPIEKGKRRVGKQVDRIFTDDDGFILTKKEFVCKSSSEDETEPKEEVKKKVEQPPKSPKKTPAVSKGVVKKSPKKKTSPLINKQSSIRNFFSKK